MNKLGDIFGLYVHIPFCKRKCDYCDFYSEINSEHLIKNYIDAVLIEAERYKNSQIDTLYIGEGTPSLLGKNIFDLVSGLRKRFNFELKEATIEVNPDSASAEFLESAINSGVDRISIGVQSLSNEELKSVGRLHDSSQALSTINLASKIGFKRISADVMIGLPGQNWESLLATISKLTELNIGQISVYCLSIEHGTPLSKNIPINLPTNDNQAELFYKTKQFLEGVGFVHVEISNFSKPGQEPLHNMNCWKGQDYIGLGAGASSYVDGVRFKNKNNLNKYIKQPTKQKIIEETLSEKERASDEAMLRFRMLAKGLNLDEMKKRYNPEIIETIHNRVINLLDEGLIVQKGNSYIIPPDGILTSNQVFERMLLDE
ncbi:MAG: radical SAM family heme chaperone HemW [Caldisericia bacterium]|nr:radical SAM family heme chaperone HemW [Caldisericia bacterium]